METVNLPTFNLSLSSVSSLLAMDCRRWSISSSFASSSSIRSWMGSFYLVTSSAPGERAHLQLCDEMRVVCVLVPQLLHMVFFAWEKLFFPGGNSSRKATSPKTTLLTSLGNSSAADSLGRTSSRVGRSAISCCPTLRASGQLFSVTFQVLIQVQRSLPKCRNSSVCIGTVTSAERTLISDSSMLRAVGGSLSSGWLSSPSSLTIRARSASRDCRISWATSDSSRFGSRPAENITVTLVMHAISSLSLGVLAYWPRTFAVNLGRMIGKISSSTT